jgi:PEP-CTERM motif-containing protein
MRPCASKAERFPFEPAFKSIRLTGFGNQDLRETNMKWITLACAALVCTLPQAAHALTIDFSQAGPPGNLGSSTYVNGPVSVGAFYLSGNSYTNAPDKNRPVTLFVRDEPFHDMGFGVCAPKEQSKRQCAFPNKYDGSGGHTNELDNDGSKELLRLQLAPGWVWSSLTLSSLDKDEHGQLWYSDTPEFNKDLASFARLYQAYDGTRQEWRDVSILGDAADARYLYLLPGPKGSDNDHLLWLVTVSQITQVPEPGSVAFVVIGLGVLGATRLRRAA